MGFRKMKITPVLLASAFAEKDLFGLERDTQCTGIGGQCLDWRYYICTAGYVTGKCNGDNNRKCCQNCDRSCQNQEAQDAKGDSKCDAMGGKCMHNSNYCKDSWHSGKCGGSSSRQCCAKGGSSGGGSCNLVRYSNTYIKGYNGLRIEIDAGFKTHVDTMNTYACQCSVKSIQVTHAFRKEGQNIGGTVVPPASHSNHLVGHAIDFNLDTPSGWCNGDCLAWKTNSYAKCFTDKIDADRNLRWGNSFNDPVHIDDNLWYSNSNKWNDLYYSNQNNC